MTDDLVEWYKGARDNLSNEIRRMEKFMREKGIYGEYVRARKSGAFRQQPLSYVCTKCGTIAMEKDAFQKCDHQNCDIQPVTQTERKLSDAEIDELLTCDLIADPKVSALMEETQKIVNRYYSENMADEGPEPKDTNGCGPEVFYGAIADLAAKAERSCWNCRHSHESSGTFSCTVGDCGPPNYTRFQSK